MLVSILGEKSKKVLDHKRARSKSQMSVYDEPRASGGLHLSVDHSAKQAPKATGRSRGGGKSGRIPQAGQLSKEDTDKPSWDVPETSLWRTVYEDLGAVRAQNNKEMQLEGLLMLAACGMPASEDYAFRSSGP